MTYLREKSQIKYLQTSITGSFKYMCYFHLSSLLEILAWINHVLVHVYTSLIWTL